MFNSSRQHLSEAGETYTEHFTFAATVALLTLGAGLACLIHAAVPGLCQRTCSQTLAKLQVLFADRSRLHDVQRDRQGVLVFVGLCILGTATAAALIALDGLSPFSGALSLLALAMPAAHLLSDRELAMSE